MLSKLGFKGKAYMAAGAIALPAMFYGYDKLLGKDSKELTKYIKKRDPDIASTLYIPANQAHGVYKTSPVPALAAASVAGGLAGHRMSRHIRRVSAGELPIDFKKAPTAVTEPYLKDLARQRNYGRGIISLLGVGVLAGTGLGFRSEFKKEPQKKNLALLSGASAAATGGLYAANLKGSKLFKELGIRRKMVGRVAAAGAVAPLLGYSWVKLERLMKKHGKEITNTT